MEPIIECRKCRWYFNGLKCKKRCRACIDFNNFVMKKCYEAKNKGKMEK
jgi:hypothetical protein